MEVLVELVLDDGTEEAGLGALEVDDAGRDGLSVTRARDQPVPCGADDERALDAGSNPARTVLFARERRDSVGAHGDHPRLKGV